jgi:hypothetical protein
MEKNNFEIDKNNIKLKDLIRKIKENKFDELSQYEKNVITIFYMYNQRITYILHFMIFYNKYLIIINFCIWIENRYKTIKNYISNFFY